MKRISFIIVVFLVLIACDKQLKTEKKSKTVSKTLFVKISSERTKIHFKNTVKENIYFNFLNYPYIYNGGGVAVGDIDNDGLVDVYFTSNQNSNKLYLNNDDFQFEDITESAKVGDEVEGWATGVTMIDVNNDGYLDIYVCKSGLFNDKTLRKNKLFVNQKNKTFIEEGEKYGLADTGFSTQAYFFDMDKDGDLDMYLVNHRPDFQNNTFIDLDFQKKIFRDGSDQLFRNDGNKFTNITKEAGVENKTWGLSASIGDFNNDGWPDVYVTNDFLEPDFLYINNQDGTFTDQLQESFNHISSNSMGSDFADFNNDLMPDLLVLDMTPQDHIRSKSNMPSMSTENFNLIVDSGYHYQYMQNTLQLNNGNTTFSEIALLSGLAKTDWSWAPLLADFDNDGFKDVFITNGILHELNNQDFRNNIKSKILKKEKMDLSVAVNMMPSEKLSNYIFKNQRDLTFKNKVKNWGLDEKTYSNGAAYADLDNDGDLDLVINNMDDEAGIYQNQATQNYLQIQLKGSSKNPLGIGAKVVVQTESFNQSQKMYLTRGFQSSVDPKLTFGVGDVASIYAVQVFWADGLLSEMTNVKSNQLIAIDYQNAKKPTFKKKVLPTYFEEQTPESLGISYKHQENEFDDFQKQILLPHSESKNGPFMDAADVNNDGLIDFFVGGAAGQAGELYLQQLNGKFHKQIINPFEKDAGFEDLGILFFDVDNDADQDLYVVSGGTEFSENSEMYQDRLYINDGLGNFIKSENVLPKMYISGQVVKVNDVDNDGDLDLFVGGRVVADKYPFSPKSYLLINENGVFKPKSLSNEFTEMGLITDAIFTDYDNDGDKDLITVGEWTKIQVFENTNGEFLKKEIPDLEKTAGLWFSLAEKDMDNDGDMDYFVGNLGLNSKFKAKLGKPFQIFCDDFDKNGTYDVILTNEYKGELVPLRGKECTSQQIPSINDKFKTFNDFAKADINSIFGEKNLKNALHLSADIFYSVYLENLGNGKFNIVKLPNALQIAPILDFEFIDVNQDGVDEIISVGNLYNTEVETVRFDASYGNIMEFIDNSFKTLSVQQTGLSTKGDTKNMKTISILKNNYLLVVNNNQEIQIFKQND